MVEKVSAERKVADKSQYRTIFDEILDDEDLPAQEKTLERLTDEATILVIAASETPAKVLCLIIYHLLAYPEWLQKIRNELSALHELNSQNPSLHQLERLPHLSSAIKEGLRLHGGIVARSQRVCRSEHLHFRDFVIPPGTPLSTSSYFIHRNSELFPQPSKFIPERWLETDSTHGLDHYLVAFGKGSRNCVGKNLGQAELYLTLAIVLRKFDFETYLTDMTDIEIERDWYVMQPKKTSQGVRVIVKEGN